VTAAPRLLVPVALAAVMAAATLLVGWWGVAAVAALFALFAAGRLRRVAGTAALAALVAWGALLLFDALGPRFGAVAVALSGVLTLPAAAIVGVALAFAALLAWSAAAVAEAVARRALGRAERAAEAAPAPPADAGDAVRDAAGNAAINLQRH
jgi:hypothetical protein